MSMFTFGGIATGLDTGAIISQLVAIKRQPIVRLEERKSLFQRQLSALTDLRGKLTALQDAVRAIDTPRDFGALAATTSDEASVTATASSLANPGTYELVVSQLAEYQKDKSDGYDSLSDNVGTGTVSITVNGETTKIDLLGPINTLSDLRDAINDSGAGVYASILNTGAETDAYHLILTSADPGEDAAFTASFGLNGGHAPTLTRVNDALDAAFSLDGIDVTSSSNVVTDAISGMTFNLLAADPAGKTIVTVETDDSAISTNIQTLVDTYNDLTSYLSAQSGADGTLDGHPVVRTVSRRLSTLFTVPLTGGTGDLTLLAQVGINRGKDHQLEFDAAEFKEALATDYASVRDLFVERGTNLGKAYLISTAIDNMIDPGEDEIQKGLFTISNQALNGKIDNIDQSIERYERSVEVYENTLQRRFMAMESLVSGLQAQGSYLSSILSQYRM